MRAVVIDRAALRKRIAGLKPRMTVEVEVQVLTALLDDMDEIDAQLCELLECVRAMRAAREKGQP
jgi:hypothetical protein